MVAVEHQAVLLPWVQGSGVGDFLMNQNLLAEDLLLNQGLHVRNPMG